ncbi:MAG TPA: PIN domain-containing protein [Jiangellaceae bacterium]
MAEVLAEIDYVIAARLGVDAEIEFLVDVDVGRYQLASFTDGDMATALGLVRQYKDLDIGVTDASIAAIAARHGTTSILTLDQRFRAIRPLNGDEAFTILPADLQPPTAQCEYDPDN